VGDDARVGIEGEEAAEKPHTPRRGADAAAGPRPCQPDEHRQRPWRRQSPHDPGRAGSDREEEPSQAYEEDRS